MSDYEDILESYFESRFQVDQVFGKELNEPIVIHSRVPNDPPLMVSSIATLRGLRPGTRLTIRCREFMKVHCKPGWVCWNGSFVDDDLVYREILSAADERTNLLFVR